MPTAFDVTTKFGVATHGEMCIFRAQMRRAVCQRMLSFLYDVILAVTVCSRTHAHFYLTACGCPFSALTLLVGRHLTYK